MSAGPAATGSIFSTSRRRSCSCLRPAARPRCSMGTATGEGMDDISTSGVTTFAELSKGKVTSGLIDPRWLNIPAAPLDELRGGDAAENAGYLEGILSGKIQGAKRDLTLVNAAGGFVVSGLCRDMNEGIARAREQIDSGRALETLHALQQFG